MCSNFRGDVFARFVGGSAARHLCSNLSSEKPTALSSNAGKHGVGEHVSCASPYKLGFPTPAGTSQRNALIPSNYDVTPDAMGQRLMFICNTALRKQLRSGRGSIFLSARYFSSSATFTAASTFCMLAGERAPSGG